MELTVALAISILSAVITVTNFVVNRKDKAVKDAKETAKEVNMDLINYRFDELDKNVQKISDKLDYYEKEIDDKIEKAIDQHVKIYHSKEK